MKTFVAILASTAALLSDTSSAFAPGNAFGVHKSATIAPTTPFGNTGPSYIADNQPVAIQRQRNSMASVQTMGLFGLGAPEIAVILVAGAFLLGPQKLAELGKEAGKMAGELKEVPKEFQEGLAEGEKQAQKLKKEISDSSSAVKDAETE
jgi:sec-independent protein translocase protein TatA